MNVSALKAFAPAVRQQLMEAVARKLDYVLTADTADLRAASAQRENLRRESARDRKALIERVAYTWFNRFAALRFLDAHGWHPFGTRVLTAATTEETLPELLRVTRTGQLPGELARHTAPARLNDLLDGRIPSADPQGEVYRHLVLAACRFYSGLLPNVFEKLDDETELLLPDDLLTEHSVVAGFRTEITDSDCAEVELLGWLYQFYISERKDEVMARKSAVPTEDIPAVTQLFTPHWIVRYLVENSLGRLWLLNRPASRLREHMPYYIEAEPETDFLTITRPEDIRVVDPAVGSGHMLTYAFDLLTLIYEEEGYPATEIPALILRHNLYGLEICPRAAQLAELALVFKARERSRRFFQPEHLVRPHIIELCDVRFAENELRDYIQALGLGDLFDQPMIELLHQFEDAKTFGSLIRPCLDERAIADVRRAIEAKDLGGQLFLHETHLKILRVLEQAEALTQRYHVVVANPPYMGGRALNAQLKTMASENFADSKADTFAMFLERGLELCNPTGFVAMVTMQSWMFLGSYEQLRDKLLSRHGLRCLLHMDNLVMGIAFGTSATVWQRQGGTKQLGSFGFVGRADLTSEGVPFEFPIATNRSAQLRNADFRNIPSCPIAYWVGTRTRAAFATFAPFGEFAETRLGMATADNNTFLRRWSEVSTNRISFNSSSRDAALTSARRWFPYAKGGDFRKWYGNNEFVVDWAQDGEGIRTFADETGKVRSHNYNLDYIFRPGITWNALSSSDTSMRLLDCALFDNAGSSCFPPVASREGSLGFLNSKLLRHFIELISPTFNYQPGDIARVPFHTGAVATPEVRGISSECIALTRADWDNFETSWDFRDEPLLRPGLKGATLEASWRNWEAQSTAAIRRMQELETENNRLFIAAYGLEGELQPEVPEDQITLVRAEARRDVAAFLSYAVGCMMGRYGLDHPGLILANASDTLQEFLAKVGKPLGELTFAPDEDGIIPVLDGEWFEDDIVTRTRDFLRATFGEDTLRENLRFIEDSLGKDLRKYFLNDFYKDHLQAYKKRPIYWLVQSPKKGFSVLFYLHRYTRDTLNVVLNQYLREYQGKLRNRLTHLTQTLADEAMPARDRTTARKEAERLTKTLHECQEWEREALLPLAQQRIVLDLDDGVKVNYSKLADVLAPVPGLAAAEE